MNRGKAQALASHVASVRASEASKERARKAAREMPKTHGEGCWFNSMLNLIHRGARPTEANLVAESKRILDAEQDFIAEQKAKRIERQAA